MDKFFYSKRKLLSSWKYLLYLKNQQFIFESWC
ncbi:hypothetical protein RDI58_028308 [Solanum bulbocastanum]|uniref:Uncharacterized protein n=1 Tax=Solanum bulbocastanum TaxID=147425 RepID=A0AAN8SRQ1_SOLBU